MWALSKLVRSQFQPESEGLKEPKIVDAPKGRPRARKTNDRNPSWHEQSSAQCNLPKGKISSTHSTTWKGTREKTSMTPTKPIPNSGVFILFSF